MFLSDASVRRPIAMGCLIIGLALLGFNAYRKMGLELMPKMDAPFVTIVTIYPGASRPTSWKPTWPSESRTRSCRSTA